MACDDSVAASSSRTTVTILYGSQTGNAEDLAKRIGLQVKSRNYSTLVMAIDDFPIKELPKQNVIIYVCSTTGHGQEPENMRLFYNFIRRRDLPRNCLSSLHFAVYGLGDSSYAKFNYVSKILFKRLKECGARPILDIVCGDEQHEFGCDGVIYPKLDVLWTNLSGIISPHASLDTHAQSRLSYEVRVCDNAQSPQDVFSPVFVEKRSIMVARCVKNERVTPKDHFQDTRHLIFEPIDDTVAYKPGDVCVIYPCNTDENVKTFISLLNLEPEMRFSLRKLDKDYMVNYMYDFVPDGLKVEELVRQYLDILAIPRRSFFEYLWPLSNDDLERTKLKEFSTTEGQEELFDYCVFPKRSILEVLIDFPKTTANIKLEHLFDIIPPMKPRSFSIASSLAKHPNQVHLIVGVVKYKTRLRKVRKGLCSTYLSLLETQNCDSQNNLLKLSINPTSFKLPDDPTQHIILIGPGLGIAPFRSFIQEKAARRTEAVQADCLIHMYFGCRYANADYYFQQELEEYERSGLIRLRVAFSRHEPKRYVQDLMLEDSDMIRELIIERRALIYVAGNSKLPQDLRNILARILGSSEDGDDKLQSGERIVTQLEDTNRIQYDCW